MRRNRLIGLLLCMGLSVAGLTGCGAADDGDQNAKTDESTVTDDVIEEMKEDGQVEDAEAQQDDTEDVADMEDTQSIQLEGLGMSILGDSISTYEGWIPEECTIFFPREGDLTDVSQTWWMQLIEETGMELCSNNSSAGSTCVGDSLSIDDPIHGCSGGRLSLLMGDGGRMPDIIIVYIGVNDLLQGAPLGDNDGMQLVEEGMIENFSDAYSLMLDKLASDYPIAQIYCCSLTPVGDWGTKQPFVTFENYLGLTAEDYSERIKVIAGNKGIRVIDLTDCGIDIDNMAEMTSDGVHLTPAGMECVKNAVLDGIGGGSIR